MRISEDWKLRRFYVQCTNQRNKSAIVMIHNFYLQMLKSLRYMRFSLLGIILDKGSKTGRKFLVDLMLSLDPGTSMTKMVYRVSLEMSSKPELLCMEPELVKISRDSLSLYESGQINRRIERMRLG